MTGDQTDRQPTPATSESGVTVTGELMDIDAVQRVLNRSRASIYRYANTDPEHPDQLNLEFDATLLNPELRNHKSEPLRFHVTEVARFARDVLGMRGVTIVQQEPAETMTNRLLQDILQELKAIHQLLAAKS